MLRALRSRRLPDWTLAGLSAGLSEYFYYGTRLLPFILALFIVFLLALHWKQARQYSSGFLLLTGGYLVGFGPLLVHFVQNPNLYLGRGASLLIWSPHIPIRVADIHEHLENDLASVVSELAWNQHSQFTRHHILRAPTVACRSRSAGSGRRAAYVALASSRRVSHTRLRTRLSYSWAERSWHIRTACHLSSTIGLLPSRPSMLHLLCL